jgi:hypothetical protein
LQLIFFPIIQVCEELQDGPENYSLHEDQNPNSKTVGLSTRNLLSKYPNGKMFYLFRLKNAAAMEQDEPMQAVEAVASGQELGMDAIDVELSEDKGKIERGRDEKLCRHNDNSRCIHCSPLEPYHEAYLKEHNIKHLSFHSYIKKMSSSASGSVRFENFSLISILILFLLFADQSLWAWKISIAKSNQAARTTFLGPKEFAPSASLVLSH